MPLLSNEEENK
jgi:hypothetical protein